MKHTPKLRAQDPSRVNTLYISGTKCQIDLKLGCKFKFLTADVSFSLSAPSIFFQLGRLAIPGEGKRNFVEYYVTPAIYYIFRTIKNVWQDFK